MEAEGFSCPKFLVFINLFSIYKSFSLPDLGLVILKQLGIELEVYFASETNDNAKIVSASKFVYNIEIYNIVA